MIKRWGFSPSDDRQLYLVISLAVKCQSPMSEDDSAALQPSLLRMLLNLTESPAVVEDTLPLLVQGFRATTAALWAEDGRLQRKCGDEQSVWSGGVAIQHARAAVHASRDTTAGAVSLKPAPAIPGRSLLTISYTDDGGPHCIQLLLRLDERRGDQLAVLQAAKLVSRHFADMALRPESDSTKSDLHGERRPTDQIASLLGFHDNLDLKETSYRIANDARHLLGVDRVSVLLRRDGRFRLQAASGQVQPDRRANAVRYLEQLADRVAALREPVDLRRTSDGDLPPEIELALDTYLNEAPTRSMSVWPLHARERPDAAHDAPDLESRPRSDVPPFGVMVVERFRSNASSGSDEAWSRAIQAAAARALQNAQRHQRVFLLPVWSSLGRWWSEPDGRWLRRAILCAGLALLIAMATVPARFEIVVDGTLQPVERRHVFATASGVVQEVLAGHGEQVEQGAVLVRLDNSDLSRSLEEVLGQIQIVRQQISSVSSLQLTVPRGNQARADQSRDRNAASNRLAAEQQRLTMQLDNLQKQYALLERQNEQLEIRSPANGTVVTWDVRQSIASRPLERGQQIMTVANEAGPWQLRLFVRDRQAGHLREAQSTLGDPLDVTFALGTEPESRFRGTLSHVSQSSQPDPKLGSSVKVTVGFDADQLTGLHDGAEVRARINCGKRKLGFVWFHQLVDIVQSRILFHFR